MAGLKSFFLTGANAKIKLNDVTLAFATDISYSIDVKHVAPKVCGQYEANTLEPLAYEVTGSFSIIRYIKDLKNVRVNEGAAVPYGVNDSGNGLGSWIKKTGGIFGSEVIGDIKKIGGNNGRADANMDPSTFHNGRFFDIEIFQKLNPTASGTVETCKVAKLRDCRITRSDFTLRKNAPAIQKFNFRALYVDEDSFRALASGNNQGNA